AGVNAWIDGSRTLPPEFVVLRIRPEPWTVRHTLALEKIMACGLSPYRTGLELGRAVRHLGDGRARHLAPQYPALVTTTPEDPSVPPAIPAAAAAWLERFSVARASNAWVIGGEHTRSGKPILANDMHLALEVPGIWYLMVLH